jgi:hypothetical protein
MFCHAMRGHTGVRIPATFTDGACKAVSAGDDGLLFVRPTGLYAAGADGSDR